MDLKKFIRDVPDFPIKGIVFKDITPLIGDYAALTESIRLLAEPFKNQKIDCVVGVESRGFVFGALLADRLKTGFVPVRKKGKLPYKTLSKSYDLEYGQACIEVHADAICQGAKVLMVDDLLATGGTMVAACDLVNQLGGKIAGVAFVVELDFLKGREKLAGYNVHSLLHYSAE